MSDLRNRTHGGRWIVAGLLVLALAGGGALWWFKHHQNAMQADPATTNLPAQTASAASLQSYFAGRGKGLLIILHSTTSLPSDPTKATCAAIAKKIGPGGTPRQLSDEAVSIPDPTVRDASLNHLRTVEQYLATCGTVEDLTVQAEQAQFTAVILSRLLSRGGVG